MSARRVRPFYFGPPSRRIFACYHEPLPGVARDLGVVLCYPMGDEYLLSHRTFRRLATQLSQNGFAVLKFDYYGCGDSAGDPEESNVATCIEDIAAAASELQRRHGCRKIGFVGLRLGATLCYVASASVQRDVYALILWEPVVQGGPYLDDLEASYAKRVRDLQLTPGVNEGNHFGYPVSQRMQTDLRQLDLRNFRAKPAENVLILTYDDETPPTRGLVSGLEREGVTCRCDRVVGSRFWVQDVNRVLVPKPTIDSILHWIFEIG